MRVVHELGGGILFQQIDYFCGRYFLRIEKGVYPEVCEQQPVLVLLVLLVVYTCRDFLGTKLFRQGGGYYIYILFGVWIDGNEQVRILNAGLYECVYGCGIAFHRHYVGFAAYLLEILLVRADDCDFMIFHAQHLGQMASDLSCSCYDNLHDGQYAYSLLILSSGSSEKVLYEIHGSVQDIE